MEGAISQEPYAFGQPLINISISALKTRYTILPYLYTLFVSAHLNATTVWRPLFFEFPTDTATFGIDTQFLIGPHLLVSPVLTQGATSVSAYFPKAQWYDYYSGETLTGTGSTVTLSAPLTFIPIHVRGGAIIPTQGPALTTTVSRNNPFALLIALDPSGNAQGDIFLDDGESLDPIVQYSFVTFTVSSGTLKATVVHNSRFTPTPPLGGVTVYGVQSAPASVLLNGESIPFTYVAALKVLKIPTNEVLVTPFTVAWK